MYQNNPITQFSRTDRDYVVYFYESGLARQYQQRQKSLFGGLNYGPIAGYDFSSDLSCRPAWPVAQTVEDVIRKGYFSIPRAELETAIISDKRSTSRLGLDDIIGQIRRRYQVYESNMHEIEVSKCSAINSFYRHEAYHGPSDSKVEYSTNKRLDRLYNEQREERANLWRDVSRLRLLLPEQARQYLSAYRKISVLDEADGGTP